MGKFLWEEMIFCFIYVHISVTFHSMKETGQELQTFFNIWSDEDLSSQSLNLGQTAKYTLQCHWLET